MLGEGQRVCHARYSPAAPASGSGRAHPHDHRRSAAARLPTPSAPRPVHTVQYYAPRPPAQHSTAGVLRAGWWPVQPARGRRQRERNGGQ